MILKYSLLFTDRMIIERRGVIKTMAYCSFTDPLGDLYV